MAGTMASAEYDPEWFLKYSCPVLLPQLEGLFMSNQEFQEFIADNLRKRLDDVDGTAGAGTEQPPENETETETSATDTFTLVTDSTSAEIRETLSKMNTAENEDADTAEKPAAPAAAHPFIEGLKKANNPAGPEGFSMENKMYTDNHDLTNVSTTNTLVDLFADLGDDVSGPRMADLLQAAWAVDSLATLKIVFNSRSIHLGKSSRNTFYRAAGWLAMTHPLTLVANLRWLSRPVIEKKANKDGEDDLVIIEDMSRGDGPDRYDVKHGVAHGYWKDLLNLLALAANGQLTAHSNPRDLLNSENPGIMRGKSTGKRKRGRKSGRGGSDEVTEPQKTHAETDMGSTMAAAKSEKHATRERRHANALELLETNHVYRALHLAVARLFAEQLTSDLSALKGEDPEAKKTISLCGKWAPSHDRFHDRHTFVVSSIAEIMYPRESFGEKIQPSDSREVYLRHAREAYRKDMSALRHHLGIVERPITAKDYKAIKYERLPSQAMSRYSQLFIEKDYDRFEQYLTRVTEGKAQMSGATLLPSTLAQKASEISYQAVYGKSVPKGSVKDIMQAKTDTMQAQVLDGQWKALVQRIKDSGSLSSSIAVCDVSGSMCSPQFPDKTCPMDSAIGLSMLISEVTEPPFGGTFITFSTRPTVQALNLSQPFVKRVHQLKRAHWSMSTNLVAVFEDLILPMAKKHKLKQEDMVKRVFIFSDMQFDSATSGGDGATWNTSFERVQGAYKDAGYELPEVIFWNLDGKRGGSASGPVAPKPVTVDDVGTSLVSGYSQAMVRVFLDNGGFEEEEEEDDDDDDDDDEEDAVILDKEGNESQKPKKKTDPLKTTKKAIGHKAYDMLKVYD